MLKWLLSLACFPFNAHAGLACLWEPSLTVVKFADMRLSEFAQGPETPDSQGDRAAAA